MAITAETNEQTFTGDGANYTFAFTENTDTASNLQVRYVGPSGIPVPLTNGTHYSLTGVAGSGGITITYPIGGASPTAPSPYDVYLSATETLVAWIEPPNTQTLNPKWNAATQPSTMTQQLDRIVRTLQLHDQTLARTYRGYVGTTIAEGTLPSVAAGSNKTLLASSTASAASTVELESANWPATFDSIELEVIGASSSAEGRFRLRYIDNGSATASNAYSTVKTFRGTTESLENGSGWRTDTTETVGTSAAQALSGSVVFNHFDTNLMSGRGSFSYRDFTNGETTLALSAYLLDTSAARLDGIEAAFTSGLITGTFRLWGLPKT